jgi:hypothetical protein
LNREIDKSSSKRNEKSKGEALKTRDSEALKEEKEFQKS